MPYIVWTQPVTKQTLLLSEGLVNSSISTTTSTGISTLVSIAKSTYRSVSFQIQATEGSNYNITSVNLLHDDTSCFMSEFGTINEPIGIATFGCELNGANITLLGFPASSNSTTFQVIYSAVKS